MKRFDDINLSYSKAFKEFGYSAAAVHIPKDNQSVRFRSVLNFLPEPTGEILSIADFGCGLGHLNEFLMKALKGPFQYTGVEINPDFLAFNRRRYLSSTFLSRDEFFAGSEKFDIVTSIGTFNLIYDEDELEHKEFVYLELKKLWHKTESILYLNFMSTAVDFRQNGAYHQDVGDLYLFLCQNLSRDITIDSSYLPFEFSAIVRKDTAKW